MPFFRNQGPEPDFSLRDPERPNCLLFAEGQTEALFLETWLSNSGRSQADIAVICYGQMSLATLLKKLSGDENFPLVSRFGFFMDAEEGVAANKAAMVTDLLVRAEVIPRGNRVRAGQLLTVGNVRIALFVSPNNDQPGFIEHMAMGEIQASNLSACINHLEACVGAATQANVNPKALVQAYLGFRKPGLCGTGRGFTSGYLDVMHNAYDQVRQTLSQLV